MSKIRRQIEAYEKHPTYVRLTITGFGSVYFKNDMPIFNGPTIVGWRAHEMMEESIACNRITFINKLPEYAKTNIWYKNGKEIAKYA